MHHFFRPIYEPHNDHANALVTELAGKIGLTLSGKKGSMHKVLLSSYLHLITWVTPDRDEVIWPIGKDNLQRKYWSHYPMATFATAKNVRTKLLEHGYLKTFKREDVYLRFGVESMEELEELIGIRKSFTGPMTYTVNGEFINADLLYSCEFVEAHKPYLQVSMVEEYTAKVQRRLQQLSSPKMPIEQVKRKFGRHYSKAQRSVQRMNKYWLHHPLEHPNKTKLPSDFYATATRIFHNEDINSGGRWYGGWNNLQSWERLSLLIDGEPVSEIDLNASQITLFSSLQGMPMEIGSEWDDAYKPVTEVLNYDEPSDKVRDKVKQVVVELIGAGNPFKDKPSKDKESPFDDSSQSVGQFQEIRDLALKFYPALTQLNKNKRLDFSGFLSFHEAEIMTQTLLELQQRNIVAYPVHDCWIVKQQDVETAVSTIRDTVNNYVTTFQRKNKLPVLNLSIPLSIEGCNLTKRRLAGCYWT